MTRRRVWGFVNPRGGTSRALQVMKNSHRRLEHEGIRCEWVTPHSKREAMDKLRSADLESYDGVLAVGGDGTAHLVANALIERGLSSQVAFGVLPSGTGNSLMTHVAARTPDVALDRILRWEPRPLDVLRIRSEKGVCYALTAVGLGLATEITMRAERWRFLGAPRYTLSTLFQLGRLTPQEVDWEDGLALPRQILLAFFCNTRFTGNGMEVAPRASIDDGYMDVIVLGMASRWRLLSLFNALRRGRLLEGACLHRVRLKHIKVKASSSSLEADGELVYDAPFSIDVCQGALRFLG